MTLRRMVLPFLLAVAMMAPSERHAIAQESHGTVYDRGRNAVFEERWNDVREIFDDFESRFPDSPHVDDAQYWLGMALYELGLAERGYEVLKRLSARHPDSPWNDDARVLMVRCAERIIKSASGGRPGFLRGDGMDPGGQPAAPPRAQVREYEDFLDESTRDESRKVQLLAIDTVLESSPQKARDLLPRLNADNTPQEAASLILDRFFGGGRVKVTLESPEGGLTDDNVAVMIRDGDTVHYLTLSEAAALASAPGGRTASGRTFSTEIVAEIREKVLRARRSLVRDDGPRGGREAADVDRVSAIMKVMDGELHYYRNGSETTRILVMRRDAGFTADNIRVFVETPAGIREIGMDRARALPEGGAGTGLSEGTARYIRAALAVIEISLTRDVTGTPH